MMLSWRKKGKARKRRVERVIQIFLAIFFTSALLLISYHYRNALAYYFTSTTSYSEEEKLHAIRNFQVLSDHDEMAAGFDISEYQGLINWTQADSIEKTFPITFVFIRSTAGKDKVDLKFTENWPAAKQYKILRGAYHYYRPDENSLEQAALFINTVKLEPGDLPPVLDIEKVPEAQSIDSLRVGLRRWLDTVERHYKVRPIIYCGASYYNDFLKEEFEGEYLFWIANYNYFVETFDEKWTFWQFTENGKIPGIIGKADINIFNGSADELQRLTIKSE